MMRSLAIASLLTGCLYVDTDGVMFGAYRVSALPLENWIGEPPVALGDGVAVATQSLIDLTGSLMLGTSTRLSHVASFTGYPRAMAALGDQLAFVARTAEGRGVWISDGTASGTHFVAPLPIELGERSEVSAVVLRGRYYVVVREDVVQGVWASDGSPDGTVQLFSGYANRPAEIDGRIVFLSTHNDAPTTLWETDGTLVHELATLPAAWCWFFERAAGALFFTCDKSQLWRSDGTAAGTFEVAEHEGLYVLPAGGGAQRAFYTVTPIGVPGMTTWMTSGAPGDSAKVIDQESHGVVELAGRLYLPTGDAIYRVDETGALVEISHTQAHDSLEPVDDLLLFSCSVDTGDEVCRSDGERDGRYTTHTSALHSPRHFVRAGELVYFASTFHRGPCEAADCSELWAIPYANMRYP